MTEPTIAERLEYLRGEIRAERISYSELSELQSLADTDLDAFEGDVELLEWAGVPEFPDSEDDDPPFWWMDLDEDPNLQDLQENITATRENTEGALFGIVSEADGGIIAYAIGQEHANLIVDALKATRPVTA